MAESTLIVYEPLRSFGDSRSYWEDYAMFYENYWGGPTSPFGVWFGNEYQAFRKALSEHLNLDESRIKDCFFLKSDKEYYIAPIGDSINIFSFKNSIPPEWFVLFDEAERKIFYTHWGFNTIHYDANIEDSIKRADTACEIIEEFFSKEIEHPVKFYLERLNEGILNVKSWLEDFVNGGFVVLSYGDICSYIHEYTLKNEKSVKEIHDFLGLVKSEKLEEAESSIRIFNQKWMEIRGKCQGSEDTQTIQ